MTTIKDRVSAVLGVGDTKGQPVRDIWLALQRKFDVPACKRKSYEAEIRRQLTVIEGEPDTEDSYQLRSQDYLARIEGEEMVLTHEQVSHLYQWYSWDGERLSRRDLLTRLAEVHGIYLSMRRLVRLMKAFGLTHDSSTLAPHELSAMSAEEAGEVILERREALARLEADRRAKGRYERLWRSQTSRTALRDWWTRELVEASLKPVRPPAVDVRPRVDTMGYATPVILLSDWHVGQCFSHALNSYGRDVYWRRVQDLAVGLARWLAGRPRKADELVFCVAGDMLDGVMPMRDGHQLEQDVHGGEQVRLAAEGLYAVIGAAWATLQVPIRVYSVGGNHDRAGGGRDHDPQRIASMWLADLTRHMVRGLSQDIMWHHEDDVVSPFLVRNTMCLLTHGDRAAAPDKLAAFYRGRGTHRNIAVLRGHFHAMKVEQVERDCVAVTNGCLPGVAPYERDRLAKGSEPLQVALEITDQGLDLVKGIRVGD